MKTCGIGILVLALAASHPLLLAGCSVAQETKDARVGGPIAGPDEDAPRRGGRPAAAQAAEESPKAPAPAAPGDAKRLMVYTASYELLVPSVADSVRTFVERVEGLGGYLQKRENDRLVCRVPAARFRELIAGIPSFGAVIRESISAADVTRDYMDLELRIENAEKSRQRLLAILEKATKVEEVLAIETDLRRLTEEIERMKGELRFLADQVAFSTVSVLFRSSAPEPAPIRTREKSRFDWLNEVGVERVLSLR